MNKSSNIIGWVSLGLLALITVVLSVYFYLGLEDTRRTDILLNWGYILIILGVFIAVVSAIVTGIIKGLNWKTLLVAVVAFVIIGVVAYVISKGAFDIPYQAGETSYSKSTNGWVELGLNFFYILLGVSILSVLFSVLYKAVKR